MKKRKKAIIFIYIMRIIVCFGISVLFFFSSHDFLSTVTFSLGYIAFAVGLIKIVGALFSKEEGLQISGGLLNGVLDIIFGVALFSYPMLGFDIVLIILGLWIMSIGLIVFYKLYFDYNSFGKKPKIISIIYALCFVIIGVFLFFMTFERADLIMKAFAFLMFIAGVKNIFVLKNLFDNDFMIIEKREDYLQE